MYAIIHTANRAAVKHTESKSLLTHPLPNNHILYCTVASIPINTEITHSHGNITRQESEHRLVLVNYDSFLLRESESRPGCLTLSVKQNGELKHVLIEHTKVGYVPHGGSEPFRSIESFVDHVSRHLQPCPIPIPSEDAGMWVDG